MFKVLNRYSLFDVLLLGMYKLITPFYFAKARLIRLPIQIRGKRFMQVGKNFTTGKYCRLEVIPKNYSKVKSTMLLIGNDVQINDNVHIAVAASVTIGNNVLIASKVFISDHNHGNYGSDPTLLHDSPMSAPIRRSLTVSPVIIEDNVWLGEFVSVLPGVTIGKGSIVGTMSVVKNSVPPFCIVVGSPAKVVKHFNFKNQQWEKV